MTRGNARWALAACALALAACKYVVFPEMEDDASDDAKKGWSATPLAVARTAAGDLRIELALSNDTGDWSAMKAAPKKPARLVAKDGGETPCETVFVSSGGHRLAPGYRMRGYVGGFKMEPELQPVAVECKGAQAAPGAKLLIDYLYVYGTYNYYEQAKNETAGTMEVKLDEVTPSLEFPGKLAGKVKLQPPEAALTGMNGVVVTLKAVERVESGLKLSWQSSNPGEYPSRVHIGVTPVIGADGFLYGFYELPDLVDVPITPAKGTADWTTEVAVPAAAKGFHVMMSLETGKKGLFEHYAVDISGKLPRG